MPTQPDIQFIRNHASQHLEDFSNEVRFSEGSSQWRCLYTALDPEIIKEPFRKDIAANFLSSAFDKNADKVKVFWLVSGHLFIFFDGPVRAVIRDYEGFLDFVTESKRPDYHFFWGLQKFWGYFDEVLAKAIEEKPQEENLDAGNKELKPGHMFFIQEDMIRHRQMRYKPLLLIVEDDRVTRHMLQAAMEKYCDIAVAWGARQARNLYREKAPNIVFLDIELPDGDGQDLAELFCAHDPGSFIVMVSGCLSEAKIERCMKAGVRDFIAKPAHESELLKFIDQYNKERQRKTASG